MFGQAINSGAVAPKGISDVDADFLVVAGGASGGGSLGGGGGAGGLRTSYGSTSGGGASNESKIGLVAGTSYIVTVGAGSNSPKR